MCGSEKVVSGQSCNPLVPILLHYLLPQLHAATTPSSVGRTLYPVPAVRLEMAIVAALAAVEAVLVASPAVFTPAALGVDDAAARTE